MNKQLYLPAFIFSHYVANLVLHVTDSKAFPNRYLPEEIMHPMKEQLPLRARHALI